MFQVITDVFHCEIKTLGYPRAAVVVFAMAVVAFNILSTVKAALKRVHGAWAKLRQVDPISTWLRKCRAPFGAG